jgi:hypothetical protein
MNESIRPTITGPVAEGAHGWAFGAPSLESCGYRQEEYFLEGTATRFKPVPVAYRPVLYDCEAVVSSTTQCAERGRLMAEFCEVAMGEARPTSRCFVSQSTGGFGQ